MTLPRRIVPGTTYLVTRRCIGRRYLLRPGSRLNDVFAYCLAAASSKYNIDVHAMCAMSNHYHLVLTDTDGVLPLFTAWLNRQIAMCVKRLRNWDEVVWEPNVATSAVELTGASETLEKVAYTLLNPVSAGLVRQPAKWPGALSDMRCLEHGTSVAPHPRVWFNDEAPKELTLRWTVPPGFSTRAEYLTALHVVVRDRLRRLHRDRRSWLGLNAVRKTPFSARPTRKKERFGRSPTFSALTRERWTHAVRQLRGFRRAYREAYAAWREGNHEVAFPSGTWWVARYAGALVAT